MKVTYWVAHRLDNDELYSIRRKTKKECALAKPSENYGAPRKVTVEYDSGFDLLTKCISPGCRYWE